MNNIYVSKEELHEMINGVIASYSDRTQNNVLKKISFNELEKQTHQLSEIYEIAYKVKDIYKSSVLKRLVAVRLILEAQKNDVAFDLKSVWKLIYGSLIELEEQDTVSSIGSQGFLAIPLYRLDKGDVSFEFLRLHIWDKSFDDYIDKEKVERFSIHSHQFHANSWILAGEIYNTRVDVEKANSPTEFSLFEIKWNNTKNEVNQRTSVAINTGEYYKVNKNNTESYRTGDIYQIPAGDYHIARVNDDFQITSTIFLFSTHKSRVKISNVLGPSNIELSEINRKTQITPKPLIQKINEIIANE